MRAQHVVRVTGAASLLGSLGGLLLAILRGQQWGAPGTPQYASYALANRLLTVPLVLMAGGSVGLYLGYRRYLGWRGRVGSALTLLGFGLMVGGTLAEFVVFTAQPYVPGWNGRNVAWMTFGLGLVLGVGGSLLLGITTWRRVELPWWAELLLVLALPLSILTCLAGHGVMGLCGVWLGLGAVLLGKAPEQETRAA